MDVRKNLQTHENLENHHWKYTTAKKARGWTKLYWCIDLHDTVITGTYNRHNDGSKIFPYAKKHWIGCLINQIIQLSCGQAVTPIQPMKCV
jgi:hypothetical protein